MLENNLTCPRYGKTVILTVNINCNINCNISYIPSGSHSINKCWGPLHNKLVTFVRLKEFKPKLAAVFCNVRQTQTCPHRVKRAHLLTCSSVRSGSTELLWIRSLSSFAQLSPLADQTAQVWCRTSHVHGKSSRRNSLRQIIIAFAAEWAIKKLLFFCRH